MSERFPEDEDRCVDPLDQATKVAQIHNDDALREARRKAAPEQVKGTDGQWETTECVDCDEPIESGRLEMGKVRCIGCQTIKEGKQKRGLL